MQEELPCTLPADVANQRSVLNTNNNRTNGGAHHPIASPPFAKVRNAILLSKLVGLISLEISIRQLFLALVVICCLIQGVIMKAVVKYSYDPRMDDELHLTKGDTIQVVDKSSDGWWKGEVRALCTKGVPESVVNASGTVKQRN